MTRRPRSALIAVLLLFLWIVPLTAAGRLRRASRLGDASPARTRASRATSSRAWTRSQPADAWAVGSFEADGFNHPRPLAERWNGTEWTSVQIPWSDEGELFGVAARASNDVWAVGGNQNGGQAVIAHWNGSDLSLVSHPNPGTFNRLYAVTALATNDVWAVGEFTNPISRTLALHWNGSSWTHVPTPTGDGYSHLYGVTALAPNDVWAVGDDGNSTLALHWNGSQWTRVPTPSPGFSADLRAVSAAPDGTVWAVGDSGADFVDDALERHVVGRSSRARARA